MVSDPRARLFSHFQTQDPSQHTSRWNDLWTENFVPWDQATPNPALVDLLSSRPSHIFSPKQLQPKTEPGAQQTIRRPKALVPGCGRGYDVLLFAAEGYDAYGVEGSSVAAKSARELANTPGIEEREAYRTRDEKVGRGKVNILDGDFFTDLWVNQVGEGSEGFDVIYDYTFLCALPPAIRHKWASRMAQLLAPQGVLICLEFPTHKAPSAGGPPWAVRPVDYVAYLSKPGEKVEYDEEGFVTGWDEEKPERNENGLVRIAHFQPERTHETGKGTDWISAWKHQ